MADIIGYLNSVEPIASWSTAKKQDMLNHYVSHFGYQENIDEGTGELVPNPESKKQFANRMLKEHIKDCVNSVRDRASKEAATYEKLDLDT